MRVSIRKYIGALCKITVYTVTNGKSNVIPCKKRKQWTVYNLRFERFLRKNVIRRCRFAPIGALLYEKVWCGADGGNPAPIRPVPSPAGGVQVNRRLNTAQPGRNAADPRPGGPIRCIPGTFPRVLYIVSRFGLAWCY